MHAPGVKEVKLQVSFRSFLPGHPITTCQEFRVTDAFLIKSYGNSSPPPNEANEEHDAEEETVRRLQSVYLVEPRRTSTAVIKFSGTLGVNNSNNKKTASIMAFAHFVLEATACQYMFADIQGTYSL